MKLSEFLNTEIFNAIGWTILHSLWQSLLLFLLLKVVLAFVKKKNSNLRYFLSLLTLVAIVIASCFTFSHQFYAHPSPQTITSPVFGNSENGGIQHSAGPSSPYLLARRDSSSLFIHYLNLISPYVTILWLLGLVVCSLRIIREGLYLRQLRRLSTEAYSRVQKKLDELKDKINLTKQTALIITHKVTEPLTFGHFKPVILLPLNYVLQVPMEELEMILAHELAHIKRKDYLVNLFQSALETIYFFNPFFQHVSDSIRNEREYCCDDMAANLCGNKQQMAFALTNLNFLLSRPALSLSAAPSENTFRERIYRLIYPSGRRGLLGKKSFFSLLILLAFVFLISNCVRNNKENEVMSVAGDSIKQLFTDNQANHKIQVFGYRKTNQNHDVLLVSSTSGKPLYGYLDGNLLSPEKLADVCKIIDQKRTVSMEDLAKMPPSARETRTLRMAQLNHEIDSIDAEIKRVKTQQKADNRDEIKNKLDIFKKYLSTRTDEVTRLSMEGYQEDVQNISTDVQLHEVLTKVITNKQYTKQQREQVTQLINARKTS